MLSTLVQAHLQIHQIVYDPLGPDIGKEWIELHNPTEKAIDLRDYMLYTTRGREGDAWALTWNGSECEVCIIQPLDYMIIGDTDVPYDNFATLRLQNTRGALKLVTENYEDLIGYGLVENGYFREQPAPDVVEGASLIRVNNTGNNFFDFIRGPAEFSIQQPFSGSYTPTLQVVVENAAPEIISAEIQNNTLIVELYDANGLEDIARIEYILREEASIVFNESSNISCSEKCIVTKQLYVRNVGTLEILVYDQQGVSGNTTIAVEPGPILEFSVDSIGSLRGLPGADIEQTITITNTGTVPLDLFASTNISLAISIGNVTLTTSEAHIASAQPGETLSLPLHMTIPTYTPSGVVAGDLFLRAAEQ